jgi:hypothetical protein
MNAHTHLVPGHIHVVFQLSIAVCASLQRVHLWHGVGLDRKAMGGGGSVSVESIIHEVLQVAQVGD